MNKNNSFKFLVIAWAITFVVILRKNKIFLSKYSKNKHAQGIYWFYIFCFRFCSSLEDFILQNKEISKEKVKEFSSLSMKLTSKVERISTLIRRT